MELVKCKECGEVQRNIHSRCVACDDKGFKDVETEIQGITLKELYGRWKMREPFLIYEDGYDNYLSSINLFLLDHSIGDEVMYIKEEVEDLREYLRLFNKNMRHTYGEEDKLATHLLSIKDDEVFVNLSRGVLYLMEIN